MGFRSLNSLVFLFLISGFFKFNVVYSYTRPPPGEIIFTEHVGTDEFPQQTRVYKGKGNKCGPIYITIGDGGNREGLATK
ncbi:hypothetical protein Lal_00023445 [Lupinus albus]|nr:hypothetical protein Lal_00023445 [Lupinus albus]